MLKSRAKKGFTLLELIIVIIIVGVLAAVALPRFFSVIEFSRSTEALAAIGSIRQAVERCYLMNSGSYLGAIPGHRCIGGYDLDAPPSDWIFSLDYPGSSPNAHFEYAVYVNGDDSGYTIYALRNTRDGGAAGLTQGIRLYQKDDTITRCGVGAFAGIGTAACASWPY